MMADIVAVGKADTLPLLNNENRRPELFVHLIHHRYRDISCRGLSDRRSTNTDDNICQGFALLIVKFQHQPRLRLSPDRMNLNKG